MSQERLQSIKENPFVRGGLTFVGVMVVVGLSIALINKVLALAKK